MIRIRKTKDWGNFNKLFGEESLKRFNWFQYEFGRRMTCLIHEELLGKVSGIKGSKSYKKRIVVAEMRTSGNRSWWAIAVRAKRLGDGQLDARNTVLDVVPRIEVKESDALYWLEKYGPYTAATLPYVPSAREAQVVGRKASADQVKRVSERNYAESGVLDSYLKQTGAEYEPREAILMKLKIVEDLEAKAIGWEFGTIKGGAAHWRPAIRFAFRQGIRILKTDRDLIRAITDPNFRAFGRFKHLRVRIKPSEVKALKRFQDKIFGKKGRL